MKWGDFKEQFSGIAWKRLTPHEVDATVSHGHEFQGVSALRQILGTQSTERLPTTYMLLKDEEDDIETIKSWSKWYDSRANQPHRTAEWRLYYPAEAGQVQAQMHAGDLMVIVALQDRSLLILMAPKDSGRERELQALFGIDSEYADAFNVRPFAESAPIDFVAASIIDALGLPRAGRPTGGDAAIVEGLVDELEEHYSEALPPGKTVAFLVRSRIPAADVIGDPDGTLMRWIEAEAAMHRGWEDRKIARRIEKGFRTADNRPDIQAFRTFSMSLRQSRVSRAGDALQYHFQAILDARRIKYVMEPEVDDGERPDFLFPGLKEYCDPDFPSKRLRMLAAKFTAKDRWRQVLNEAQRIKPKHLLTLEAGISAKQRRLMEIAKLILVIPSLIGALYERTDGTPILSVSDFLAELSNL